MGVRGQSAAKRGFSRWSTLLAASASAALILSLTGCILTSSGAPVAGRDSKAQTIVIEYDVTGSIRGSTRLAAKQAIADAIPALVGEGRGVTTIYFRKINHYSGSGRAAVASYTIPAVRMCTNPLDGRCRDKRDHELAQARVRALAIGDSIRHRTFKTEAAGTVIRPALAAGAEILQSAPGQHWLVVASDFLPSHGSPPTPKINLTRVHVVVLFLCRDAIATCQDRRQTRTAELYAYGASDVSFFSPEQAALIFDRTETSR